MRTAKCIWYIPVEPFRHKRPSSARRGENCRRTLAVREPASKKPVRRSRADEKGYFKLTISRSLTKLGVPAIAGTRPTAMRDPLPSGVN